MLKFFLWSIVSGFLGGFKQPELFTWFWVGLIGGGLAYLIRNCDDKWPECWWEESWLEIPHLLCQLNWPASRGSSGCVLRFR